MATIQEQLSLRLGTRLAKAILAEARGRNYPVAWASLEPEQSVEIEPESSDDLMLRPPPGLASVRPSVPAPQLVSRADDQVLATAAESAFFSANDAGEATFDLMISDELFENLRCSITVGRNGVAAIFHVGDDVDLRRLLEAESGRLRASLEARGLRSVSVTIENS